MRTSRNHESAIIYYYNGIDCVTFTLADLKIFAYQCNGQTDQQISDQLQISVHTVSNTLSNCRKRNNKPTLVLAALAVSLGLLDPDSLEQLQNAYEDMR